MNGQITMNNNQTLNAKEQSIATVSAFTAKGDLEQLRKALHKGLDAGLTVNEIKEVLVQLYAYCGFPRSLNGINAFMSVLEDRKKRGIEDATGREATAVKDDGSKYERGKKVLETLTGRVESGPKTGFAAFSPEIDVFLKEHLFADIFERDILSYQDREITTISALISLGGVESQLQAHMNMGLRVGLSKAQLEQILSIINEGIGKKEADAGRRVLAEVVPSKGM